MVHCEKRVKRNGIFSVRQKKTGHIIKPIMSSASPFPSLVSLLLILILGGYLYFDSTLLALLSFRDDDEAVREEQRMFDTSSFLCWNRPISHLSQDPCYANPRLNMDLCVLPDGPHSNEITYILPPSPPIVDESGHSSFTLLGDASSPKIHQLEEDSPIVVFIHSNKAAGETIKQYFFNALELNRWDGAALGSKPGWTFRGSPWLPLSDKNNSSLDWNGPLAGNPLKGYNRGPAMYAQCGIRFSTFAQVQDFFMQGHDLKEARVCPLKFVLRFQILLLRRG